MGPTDINYRYFVDFLTPLAAGRELRILDYGCGDGAIVRLLRQAGIECYGAEACYEGASHEPLYASDLFQQGVIRRISEDGNVPFDDRFFDIVVSNQVFEHVADKAAVFRELSRILKDDGFMRHHFPSREVWREGHVGIPFVHRLPRGRLRYLYTRTLRTVGLGHFKADLPVDVWTRRALDWIDRFCFYEPSRQLHRALATSFIVTHRELDYCFYRARHRPLVTAVLKIRPLQPLYAYLFRRLAFMVIEVSKRSPGSPHVLDQPGRELAGLVPARPSASSG
jgi:SAM-dependent methyltransferase